MSQAKPSFSRYDLSPLGGRELIGVGWRVSVRVSRAACIASPAHIPAMVGKNRISLKRTDGCRVTHLLRVFTGVSSPSDAALTLYPEVRQDAKVEGPACRLRASEGPACQVRCARLDYPFGFCGHDERAPPILPFLEGPACQVRASEGPACRVRCARLDHPFHFDGRDKRVPPREVRQSSLSPFKCVITSENAAAPHAAQDLLPRCSLAT